MNLFKVNHITSNKWKPYDATYCLPELNLNIKLHAGRGAATALQTDLCVHLFLSHEDTFSHSSAGNHQLIKHVSRAMQ